MRFRSLNQALYGEDGPDETEVAERELQPTPDDPQDEGAQPEQPDPEPAQPASMPVEPEQARPVAPVRAPAPAKKEWSPDFLGAMAAFTRNPALMQQLQEREAGKQRAVAEAKSDDAREQDLVFRRNKDTREQAKFEAERPYYGSAGASKGAYADATRSRMDNERADTDRSSERSKGVSAAASSALLAQVAQLEANGRTPPGVVAELKKTAMAMQGMSVNEIKSIFKASPLAKIAPQALGEAQRAVSNELAKSGDARGWKSTNEGIRQGDERLDVARTAEDRMQSKDDELTIKKPQEKLNHDISKLEVATQQMQDALATKGQVNTGPIIQGLRDLIHADSFDALTSDDRVKLRSLGASIFNEKVHEISGAAVSESEWKRIAPQIPQDTDDDRIYAQKLERALAITQQVLSERRKEYQMNGGKPADRSVTAREQEQKIRPTNSSPAPVVDADPRVARAKEILADPAESPEKKAKAQRWLAAQGK